MNKIFFILLVALSCASLNSFAGENDYDEVSPKVLSLKLNRWIFKPGDVIELNVEAKDENSGLLNYSYTGTSFEVKPINENRWFKHTLTQGYRKEDETHIVFYRSINTWEKPGIYRITKISVEDNADNHAILKYKNGFENYIDASTGEEQNIPVIYFVVNYHEQAVTDLTPPEIISAKLNKISFYQGEKLELTIVSKDDNSGLLSYDYTGTSFDVKPLNGDHEFKHVLNQGYRSINDTSVVIYRDIDSYQEPGSYIITSFSIEDNAYNETVLIYKDGFKNYINKSTNKETSTPLIKFEVISQ